MAAAEGTVIACHSKDELDAQLAKAGKAGKLVVIDFTSARCPPCQRIAPVFAECAKEYSTAAVFLEVGDDQLQEVGESYCINGVTPTFVFIRKGLTLETFAGAFPDKLRNTIKEFIDNDTAASASCA